MKNFMIFVVLAAVIAGGVFFYLSQQNNAQLPYDVQSAQDNATTETLSDGLSGVYCLVDNADRTLVIHQEDGSPDITFGVSYWFKTQHNCAVSGEAQLIDENTWVYTKQKMDGSTCQVKIQIIDNNINITEEQRCSPDNCGALAELGKASFSKETKHAKATKNKALGIREQVLCP